MKKNLNMYILYGLVGLFVVYLLSLLGYDRIRMIGTLVSLVLAVYVFTIVITSRRHLRNKGLVFIGISYIFIAVLFLVNILDLNGFLTPLSDVKRFSNIIGFFEIVVFISGMTIFFKAKKLNIRKILLIEALITVVVITAFTRFNLYPVFNNNVTTEVFNTILHSIFIFGYLVVISVIMLRRDSLDYDFKYFILVIIGLITFELSELMEITNPFMYSFAWLVAIGALSLLVYIVYFLGYKTVLDSACKDLEISRDKLLELSRIDELTLVANRRFLFETIDKNFRLAKREEQSIAFLMIDVDDFKFYNDVFGHLRGDSILRRIARTIEKSCKRPLDFVGRYGGEEFCVVLPNSDFEGAMVLCKRILKNIRDLRIEHYSKPGEFLSLSIGFSVVSPKQHNTIDHCLQVADEYLYKVKATGKNNFMGINLDEGEENE